MANRTIAAEAVMLNSCDGLPVFKPEQSIYQAEIHRANAIRQKA